MNNNTATIEKPAIENNKLMDIISGILGYPAVFAAHDIGLFDLLKDKAYTLDEISTKLSLQERPASALVAVNTSLGLLDKDQQGRYSLATVSKQYLLKDSPTYFGAFLDLVVMNESSISISSLKKALQTDSTQAYEGEDIFEKHAEQAEHAQAFTRAMHSASMAPAMFWPQKIDLAQNKRLLDIGGGSGAHTIGAIKYWPHLEGIIYDIAPVCDVAAEFAQTYDMAEKISTHSSDMWSAPFPDADIHFYSQIYHDWPHDKCTFLTEKSYQHLPPGGRIIVHEILYDDDMTGPFPAAASSIGMLLWTQGRQYSGKQLHTMLEKAGFTNIQTIPTYGYWSIVVGEKH